MSDLLVDLETFLITNNIATLDGTDIFRDFMPDMPDHVVVVGEYAGVPGDVGVDTQLRSIQIQVRDTSYALARSKIHTIYKLLHQALDPIIYITDTRWTVVQLRQTPFSLGRDKQGRVTFTFNLGVLTHED